MKKSIKCVMPFILLIFSYTLHAQKKDKQQTLFLKHSDQALTMIAEAAGELSVTGVAIVAYIPGEVTESWVSKMKVVGKLTSETSNLLGVASTKAAEMADTFQNSGSKVREPLRGEYGYKGGVIEKVKGGYVLAVFSGATGEQDVAVSKEGLAHLLEILN